MVQVVGAEYRVVCIACVKFFDHTHITFKPCPFCTIGAVACAYIGEAGKYFWL